MSIKISIITPCFNSVAFIQRAINSVLEQRDTNFEHIIIDGGSTDGTLEILKKYEHLKIVSEPDRGQSDAMNKGFKLSTGDVIAYLNSDDFFLTGTFSEVRSSFLNDNPDIVVGDLLIRQNDVDRISQSEWRHHKIIHPKYYGFPYNPVSYFYKRQIQETIGLFPVKEQFVMDYWFIIRSFKLGTVKKISKTFGCFYIHENCKTHSVLDSNLMLQNTIDEFYLEQSTLNRITYSVTEVIYNILRLLRII